MSVITITLPQSELSDLADKELRLEIKAGFKQSCEEGLKPQFVTIGRGEPRRTVSLYLTSREKALLEKEKAAYSHESDARVVAGLYRASKAVSVTQNEEQTIVKESLPDKWYASHIESGMEPRAEQKKVMRYAARAYSEKKIGLIECSTGFGKSAIIGTQTYEIGKDKNLVVTAPSYAILRTLISQYLRFEKQEDFSSFVLLCGKNEYLSRDLLLDYIDEHENSLVAKLLHDWVATQASKPNALGKTWMVEDAKALDPELPSEVLSISHTLNPEDEGLVAYMEQFESASRARVVFCTHTMLAFDLIFSRINHSSMKVSKDSVDGLLDAWKAENDHLHPLSRSFAVNELKMRELGEMPGLFASYQDLIVDEAHELSGAIGRSGSVKFSFWSVKHECLELSKRYGLSDGGIAEHFQGIAGSVSGDQVLINDGRPHSGVNKKPFAAANKFLDAMMFVMEQAEKKKVDKSDLRMLRSRIGVLRGIINSSPKVGIYSEIQLTSFKRYPVWICGRRTIEPDMDLLWRRVDHASLYSATLYSYTNAGPSHYFTARSLSLPKDRLLVFEPMIARWQMEPLQLNLPERLFDSKDSKRLWLEPVSKGLADKQKSLQALKALKDTWAGEVSSVLQGIFRKAKGGVVVLCTSYEDVDKLSKAFKDGARPLIKSERGVKASSCIHRFSYFCDQGKRPVWIAVGAAWTGLEIVNKNVRPEDDNWLTDVVIPKLPFGLDDTSSHLSMWRDNRQQSFYATGVQCFFRVKQGIGRLVRRPGSAQKNVWLLDSRIYKSNWKALAGPTYGYLSRFTKKKTFKKESST